MLKIYVLDMRCGSNIKSAIFKLMQNISHRWIPQNPANEKSTLVQVLSWCRQATSHYLSLCWSRFMSPYGIFRPQWIKHCLTCLCLQWLPCRLQQSVCIGLGKPPPHPRLVLPRAAVCADSCECLQSDWKALQLFILHVQSNLGPISIYKDHLSRFGDYCYKDKTIVRHSYSYDGNPCTGKAVYFYWDSCELWNIRYLSLDQNDISLQLFWCP